MFHPRTEQRKVLNFQNIPLYSGSLPRYSGAEIGIVSSLSRKSTIHLIKYNLRNENKCILKSLEIRENYFIKSSYLTSKFKQVASTLWCLKKPTHVNLKPS